MMYEHIVASLREAYSGKDVSGIKDHVAIQFNIWGEGHGALYMEIGDGKIQIEPYEYFDRDTLISTDAQTLLGIAEGKVDLMKYGDFCVEGDHRGVEILKEISRKEPKESVPEKAVQESGSVKEKKAGKNDKAKSRKKTRNAKDVVLEKAGGAKDVVLEKAGGAKDVVLEKAGGAKDVVLEKAGGAKDVVLEKAGGAKDVVLEKAGGAKGVVLEKAGSAKDAVVEKAGDAAETVKGKVRKRK